ncbi:MAG: DNA-processing protein DprA [Candidatus Daviesbacteria bacterium]|nr:DNA-processing protein DprA [Candidatus Daviesbacteria bacterium]
MDIKRLTIFDKEYPILLKEIYDPPVVLYYKGKLDLNNKTIAVVGSRKMTDQGRSATVEFTKGLVNAGFTIISGLARGVDSTAHLTAISERGKTIAVLGSGLNNIYPQENIELAEKIAGGFGAIISEFPPDYPVKPENFPQRNRIISGLSLAVLIVEAKNNSGSAITARAALEQGREVFVIPPNDLIKDGATAVFHPEEILHEMGF